MCDVTNFKTQCRHLAILSKISLNNNICEIYAINIHIYKNLSVIGKQSFYVIS